MSRTTPEVLVVGGGPAGSACALLLAHRGVDVLLLDKARFPRAKPCGECVNPGAVAALHRLGLHETVSALAPARLDGWRLRDGRAEVSASFGDGLHGLGVPRRTFDAALLEAARRAGVRVAEGERVVGVRPATGPGARPGVEVRGRGAKSSTHTLAPRVVVGADGLRSVVVRSLGLVARPARIRKLSLTAHVAGTGLPTGHGLLHVSRGTTLGVAPVGEDRWNVTVVTGTPAPRGSPSPDPAGFVGAVLGERLPGARWDFLDAPGASGPFDLPVRCAWAPGVVLVGDAAGYFDPFTGQGIYRALRTAELAAGAVVEALAERGWAPLAAYDRRWRQEVRWSRYVQRGVEAVVSRPRLREAVLRRLDASGGLQQVIRVTGDAAAPSSLLDTRVWLGG